MNSDLRRADLSGAQMIGANLARAKLAYAILKPVELRDPKGNLTGKMAATNVRGANFFEADVNHVDWSEAVGAEGIGVTKT